MECFIRLDRILIFFLNYIVFNNIEGKTLTVCFIWAQRPARFKTFQSG